MQSPVASPLESLETPASTAHHMAHCWPNAAEHAASEQNVDRGVEELSTWVDPRSKLSGGPWEAQGEVVVRVLRSGGLQEEEDEGRGLRHVADAGYR